MTLSEIKPGMRVAYAKDKHGDGPGTVRYVHLAFVMVNFDISPLFVVACHPKDLIELKEKETP